MDQADDNSLPALLTKRDPERFREIVNTCPERRAEKRIQRTAWILSHVLHKTRCEHVNGLCPAGWLNEQTSTGSSPYVLVDIVGPLAATVENIDDTLKYIRLEAISTNNRLLYVRKFKIQYLNPIFRQERSNSFWYSKLATLLCLDRFCDLGRYFNIRISFGLQAETTLETIKKKYIYCVPVRSLGLWSFFSFYTSVGFRGHNSWNSTSPQLPGSFKLNFQLPFFAKSLDGFCTNLKKNGSSKFKDPEVIQMQSEKTRTHKNNEKYSIKKEIAWLSSALFALRERRRKYIARTESYNGFKCNV